MKKKIRRKRGPVRAKKVTFDGIQFASGLEKYMYLALKEAKIGQIDISADFTRSASISLGRIVGSVDIEDVLDEIFLGFCIGK